jgi:hypothetical protein
MWYVVAYIGLNKMNELSPDYSLFYIYSFYLLLPRDTHNENSSDHWLHLHSDTHHMTIHTDNYTREVINYVDIGKGCMYGSQKLVRNRDRIIDRDGFMTIRCKLRAMPMPVVMSLRDDCKAETGMVGLENLGATCYLNSMLQVYYKILVASSG